MKGEVARLPSQAPPSTCPCCLCPHSVHSKWSARALKAELAEGTQRGVGSVGSNQVGYLPKNCLSLNLNLQITSSLFFALLKPFLEINSYSSARTTSKGLCLEGLSPASL